MFVQGKGPASLDKAYILPLSPGHLVPESIVHGLPSEQEIVKLPGVRVIRFERTLCPARLLIYTPSRARACSATCIGFPCREGGKPGQGLHLAIVPGPNGARKYRPWASVRAGDLEAARSAGHSFRQRCARPDCGYIRLHARERAAQPVSDSCAVIRRLAGC